MKLLAGECHWTHLMISQHWFREWLGAIIWLLSHNAVYSHSMSIICGLILGSHPANERCCYKVTPSLIGWEQTYIQLWYIYVTIKLMWHQILIQISIEVADHLVPIKHQDIYNNRDIGQWAHFRRLTATLAGFFMALLNIYLCLKGNLSQSRDKSPPHRIRKYVLVLCHIRTPGAPVTNPLILIWISNYIHYKVWAETTYPFPNFNKYGRMDKKFLLKFFGHVISYPQWNFIQLIEAEWRIYASEN